MAKWAVPHFDSKGQVDKAGKSLVTASLSAIERASVLSTINNWRAIHSYPLHITKVNLKRRAERISKQSIIAQRLKRLSSISLKLRRNSHMKLTQMQDIGGCRAILPTMKDVRQLIQIYEEAIAKNPPEKERKTQPTKPNPQIRPELVERYDYIKNPKPDGYRSFHYVFKYRSAADDKQIYDGLRVEIQIRTKLQHAWATAVEAISTFTEQALKSGIGDARWKRFFALMGSAIADAENCPTVPNTPERPSELIVEIRKLYQELQVEMVLMGITVTVDRLKAETDAQAYLLVLDAERRVLEVRSYKANELANANEEYLLVEQQFADNPQVQAVLVSVDSLASLQSAYPNYYLDTRGFLSIVKGLIGDRRERRSHGKSTGKAGAEKRVHPFSKFSRKNRRGS
jgi:ppGpp synthetase/RelA/SpoT-type nucleotidyltranferase